MIVHNVEQRSPEWFDLRKGIPTASEFSRIITAKTGKLSASVDEYIAELILESIGFTPDDEEIVNTGWMDRGAYLEEEARDWYAFQFDTEVAQVGLIMNDDQTASFSPDGVIVELESPGDPPEWADFGLLEVKCPKPSKQVKHVLQGILPDEYRAQVHGALAISGADWLDFVSYCPNLKPFVLRVTPDEYTEKVRSALAEFLDRLEEAKAKLIKEAA